MACSHIYATRTGLRPGGLAGYGVSRDEPFCLASAYVVRIQSQGR
jgi:hypothetical protein